MTQSFHPIDGNSTDLYQVYSFYPCHSYFLSFRPFLCPFVLCLRSLPWFSWVTHHEIAALLMTRKVPYCDLLIVCVRDREWEREIMPLLYSQAEMWELPLRPLRSPRSIPMRFLGWPRQTITRVMYTRARTHTGTESARWMHGYPSRTRIGCGIGSKLQTALPFPQPISHGEDLNSVSLTTRLPLSPYFLMLWW